MTLCCFTPAEDGALRLLRKTYSCENLDISELLTCSKRIIDIYMICCLACGKEIVWVAGCGWCLLGSTAGKVYRVKSCPVIHTFQLLTHFPQAPSFTKISPVWQWTLTIAWVHWIHMASRWSTVASRSWTLTSHWSLCSSTWVSIFLNEKQFLAGEGLSRSLD